MNLVELPDFEATWWPLRMETIPGSGETMTVAVVARAASGQAQVRRSCAPAVLSTLFGGAKGAEVIVGTTIIDLQRQLDRGVPVDSLEMPFGGFELASGRECVARNFNEVFDIAVRLSTAFGQSPFGRPQKISEGSRQAFDDWADRVRQQLLMLESAQLQPQEFNVRVRLATKGVLVGFMRGQYAVNFGVMRPGSTAGDTRSLKVKIFDLEAIRRDQILPLKRTEVLLGCPPESALQSFSRREVDSFHQSLAFVEGEAKARAVEFHRFSDHAEAANHIRQALANGA